MTLIDLSHTSHTRARTGIQRVCRSLHAALSNSDAAGPVTGITWDPYRRLWRSLEAWEEDNLVRDGSAEKRGAKWPLAARVRSTMLRWADRPLRHRVAGTRLIVPELFSPAVAHALPELRRSLSGPCVAIFHDAIALRLPEYTPSKTVARFPAYLQELLTFDGVAAVSEDSRQALVDWWKWLGATPTPPVVALPLAVDTPAPDRALARATAAPVVLSVGSLEARKNHLALLSACERLWQRGIAFELRLIGLTQLQTGREALAQVRALQQAGRPLRYDGSVDDATLRAAYHECAFTVYPSLLEGFGVPVLESLTYGKPCICSGLGALGESARGGGCITLPEVSDQALEHAILRLLTNEDEREHLSLEAKRRTFRTWTTYASELVNWMDTLGPNPGRREN